MKINMTVDVRFSNSSDSTNIQGHDIIKGTSLIEILSKFSILLLGYATKWQEIDERKINDDDIPF